MCHRTWAAMTAIAAVKRRWLCNYEQGQRSFEWPLMQGDRMWVKEPNYQPERRINERYILVTRIHFWLSEDEVVYCNLNQKLLPLCHIVLHEWLSHSVLLHFGCHPLNVRLGWEKKNMKKRIFSQDKKRVIFPWLLLTKKCKYH